MTRFWRDGFWRTGRYGNTHWVSGHWVDRDDWDRFGGGTPSPVDQWRARLDSVRARHSSTARFVTPNATCPECGADVFFYQNQYGSRVYFDDLGPPWPKHPCTDSGAPSRPRGSRAAGEQAPQARGDDEIVQIHAWTNAAYVYPDSRFAGRHGHKPWHLAELAKRIRGKRGTFFILRDLTEGRSRKLFMSARSLPRSLTEGTLVAVERGWISYLDLPSMQAREVAATRIRSAAAFIDALLEGGPGGE